MTSLILFSYNYYSMVLGSLISSSGFDNVFGYIVLVKFALLNYGLKLIAGEDDLINV